MERDPCGRRCRIAEEAVILKRFKCAARLKNENQRCARIRHAYRVLWVGFTLRGKEKFFPFCRQHAIENAIPFNFSEGTNHPQEIPLGHQGFAIGPGCFPVRRESKWRCALDETNLKGTTCWKDASIVQISGFYKYQKSCQNLPVKKRPPHALNFIPYSKKYAMQKLLTKAAASNEYYDQLALPLFQNISNIIQTVFKGKAVLILKGSRALYFALLNSIKNIVTVKRTNYFPFLLCEGKYVGPSKETRTIDELLELETNDIKELLPASDYDAQMFLDYPSDKYLAAKSIAEDIVKSEFISLIKKQEKKTESFFDEIINNVNKEDYKNEYEISAIKRRSFTITSEHEQNFVIQTRRFIGQANLRFSTNPPSVEFDLLSPDLTRVSFGDVERIWNVQKLQGSYYIDLQVESVSVEEFKQMYHEFINQEIPVLALEIMEDLPEYSTYMTNQTLRLSEQLSFHFTLLRLMASYEITVRNTDLKAKTKAEIVDISIAMPDARDFADIQNKFAKLKGREKYSFEYKGLRMANLRYQEEDLVTMIQEPMIKREKTRKRLRHIYYLVCCITQMTEILYTCFDCHLKPVESKKAAKNLINFISYQLRTYAELKEVDMKPFKHGIAKLPYKTLQFVDVFVSRMKERLLDDEKDLVPPLDERKRHVKKIINLVKSADKEACVNIKTLIKGILSIFDVQHLGKDLKDLETPLSDLFGMHGFD